jgi:hypothetical protein
MRISIIFPRASSTIKLGVIDRISWSATCKTRKQDLQPQECPVEVSQGPEGWFWRQPIHNVKNRATWAKHGERTAGTTATVGLSFRSVVATTTLETTSVAGVGSLRSLVNTDDATIEP